MDYSEYVISIRRQIHAHPEISKEEYNTSALVKAELDKIGVPWVQCGGETGVLATIQGAHPGKTILLRGDMDALTVTEENDLEFKSQNPGVMHACGHDCHTAMLLTAAHLLQARRDSLNGTVKLAFQPGEEVAYGAQAMIAEGAMEGVDAVFGMHVWADVEAGKVCVEAGPRMASADMFEIWVQGKGGHGAEPHKCHDAVTCCAAIINSLQTIVSREFSPLEPAVCTVGRVEIGSRWNVIADSGYLSGTTRCYNQEIYKEFPERIERIASGIAETYRCEAKFKNTVLTHPTINHPTMSAIAQEAVRKVFGEDANAPLTPTTGGEDFCYFIDAAPDQMGAMAFIGIGSDACDSWHPNHSPKFKVDESALFNGAQLYAQVAQDFLNG